MSEWDWTIIGLYFVATLLIGLAFAKRAGRNTGEFFLGGRNMPWWLAGLSMVATTFAADTPLAVTELVATKGIAGNWLWWNMVIGGMLTVFFFARSWRRAGILTDLEFIELRYSGTPAAVLRGFRAAYFGLFMNAIILGWVNLAMAAILVGLFGVPESQVLWYIGLAMLLTAAYASLSGLWGVVVTDAVQFVFAMGGCVILAVLVVQSPEIGGVEGLQSLLPASTFSLLPRIEDTGSAATGVLTLSAGAFLAYIGVQWWASWYPGAEPGGGGYIAQRMMSTRNEKHAVWSVLFFQVAHYCLRPWPWILVGLASLVLYPELGQADKKLGYIYAMDQFLPSGLKGLLVAAFFAAYMSTVATHLNWGSSYLVHDLWRRFVRPGRDERHYVAVSRIVTVLLMLASLLITAFIDTVSGAWTFIIECGAGLGLVLILRWYWWRINAWSEIAATITPFLVYGFLTVLNATVWAEQPVQFPDTLFIIVTLTTASWLLVTFITRPTDAEVLKNFYLRIRPGGRLWAPVASTLGIPQPPSDFARLVTGWLSGVAFVYSMLFLSHALFFMDFSHILLWSAAAIVSGGILTLLLGTLNFSSGDAS